MTFSKVGRLPETWPLACTLPGSDPSYPTLCIPPPERNYGQIAATNFPVIGSDPHGLDADGDGIGSEH